MSAGYTTPWLTISPAPGEADPPLPELVPTGATRQFLLDRVRAVYGQILAAEDPAAATGEAAHDH